MIFYREKLIADELSKTEIENFNFLRIMLRNGGVRCILTSLPYFAVLFTTGFIFGKKIF